MKTKTRKSSQTHQPTRSSLNGSTTLRLKQIAKVVGGIVVGSQEVVITGVSGIKEAKAGDITFLANSKYAQLLETTQASAIITGMDVKTSPKPLIRTENPSLAFAKLAAYLSPESTQHPQGVSPKALMGQGVRLGKEVSIQAFAVIEDNAVIGDRTIIYAGAYVGRNARIGNDVLIYPHVAIREKVQIGNRVIIHSGSVIGSDGFGFATVKGIHHKIPQIGTVIIEDDVEIGSNVTIDRARFGKTVVGKGTKIDNLVQIAHNVEIGSNCIVVAQAGISGSTRLGNNVVLAGQSGIVGHITIGDNVSVGAQAGVSKSIPANTEVWGYPARPLPKAKRINAAVQRLPELYREIEQLRQRIRQLEERLGRE